MVVGYWEVEAGALLCVPVVQEGDLFAAMSLRHAGRISSRFRSSADSKVATSLSQIASSARKAFSNQLGGGEFFGR